VKGIGVVERQPCVALRNGIVAGPVAVVVDSGLADRALAVERARVDLGIAVVAVAIGERPGVAIVVDTIRKRTVPGCPAEAGAALPCAAALAAAALPCAAALAAAALPCAAALVASALARASEA